MLGEVDKKVIFISGKLWQELKNSLYFGEKKKSYTSNSQSDMGQIYLHQ